MSSNISFIVIVIVYVTKVKETTIPLKNTKDAGEITID